jgi:hypothetical protein
MPTERNYFKKGNDPKRAGNGRKKGQTKAMQMLEKIELASKEEQRKKKKGKEKIEDVKPYQIVNEKIDEASVYLMRYILPDELASKMATLAKMGDKDMIKIIGEYFWGKPVNKVNAEVESNEDNPIKIYFLPSKNTEVNNEQ